MRESLLKIANGTSWDGGYTEVAQQVEVLPT